jgi:ATP-dependent protease ClpP protease subunit
VSSNQSSIPSKALQFPRTADLPRQSPKYWVKEKDRYFRQLMISDVEAITGRPMVVYFAQLDQEIGHTDPDDLSEILSGIAYTDIDFFIHTPGGNVDATEKMISILKQRSQSYRVVVPSWAKSAGTVLALSSVKIVVGVNSELGPIDPQWKTANGNVPGELIANDTALPHHVRQMADLSVQRNRTLAKQLLSKGMMSGKTDQEIEDVLSKISSSKGYLSHGAVIDYVEATNLGLTVEFLKPDDDLWKRIWLLYCLYEYDSKQNNLAKIFEGSVYSISRPKPGA